MRTYYILILLCFSSLLAFSQKLEIKKASPFTAVQWEKEQPIVQFDNEWYHFEKLEHFSKKQILEFCKKQYGHKWQKRFSEDLVEVLQGLGYQPNIKVALQLSKEGVIKTYTGTFTSRNRDLSLQYNNAIVTPKSINTLSRKITLADALADLKQFEQILAYRSSYAQLSMFDYKKAIRELAESIIRKNKEIEINEFTNELSKIMSEIGDRHSSIMNEVFDKKNHKTHNLRLPFGVTTIDGKIVAVKQDQNDKKYSYYDTTHPYIKSIDEIAVETLINTYNYRDKKAPTQTKLSRGSHAIQKYGELLFKNTIPCPDSVTVVFSNDSSEKKEIVPLTTINNEYFSKTLQENYKNRSKVENGNFDDLHKRVGQNIGYINIPRMYHYDEIEGLENFIENTLQRFSNTKALIIDIRNNPGGGREILQTFAQYIVQPEQSPWIANVAYLRTDATPLEDVASMNARYLYSYNATQLTDTDRTAIDQFNTNFELQAKIDTSKFSNPFYMVLHHGDKPYTQPVYILINEQSFSAATVFTSAFKSLPNVNIVGVTTDGSSGNSRVLHLNYSNIRVKVSTMLSFQRNGKTLDGHGTVPDISIPIDEIQLLEGVDTQLSTLIEMINSK
ncbi:S41 family peptidase [Dokdonia sp.]|uniref:S41 family peptidase n=1 Tax=Dokdonia sp. TaxID=2024995 RepID=UPI0032646C69